ncbi:SdrD B-like domain-containing protein [Clostridium sp.]|uniref:SdrD B-like domain-containing protein n=1 Tax=Clostridium sp. TaxID=1506 RepID=UPI003F3782C1
MSALFKNVDKTIVNFEDNFTYTINISFSGIEGDIDSAKVTDFIPSYITYVLPPISGLIKNITQTLVDEGTLITFDFGRITNLGISIALNLICKFKLGSDNQTSFVNTSNLYINDNLIETSSSENVTLSFVDDFILEKSIAIPTNKNSTPGGRVLFTITLRNKLKSQGGNGDLGAKIKNINISDLLPVGLSVDSNYPVKGSDISASPYADNRYNNKLGTIDENNNITFTLDDYYGTKYRIIVVCNVDSDLDKEIYLSNTATLTIDGIFRNDATDSIYITDANYNSTINKSGPMYCGLNDYISFDLSNSNTGNTDLLNFTIEDIIPDEVTIYRINTGSFAIAIINIPVPQDYTIEYELDNSQTYILLGTYNTQSAVYVNLPTLLPNQKITRIRWNIPNFPVGIVPSQNIILDGILTSSNSSNTTTNIAFATSNTNNIQTFAQSTKIVDTSGKSVLNVNKYVKDNITNVVPGQIIRYSISFNGNESQINSPVIADLLSEKLEYIGNELYTLYDYFNNQTIKSNMPSFSSNVSIVKEVISNYNNIEKTLVRYDLNGFSLRQKGKFTIEFDVKVKVGATGTILNNCTLGNKGADAIIATNQPKYLDVDDRDNDSITDEYLALSYNTNTNILYYAALSTDKKVRGELDNEYLEEPNIGLTFEGGKVDYKIVITNVGNLNFEYIELVDILPHINDTGVILTNSLRKSQFNVYNTKQITANIVENNIIINNIILNLQFSKSYNPLRFGQDNLGNSTIGLEDDWSIALPTPPSDTKSIKLTLSNEILRPNQSLIIDIHCIAPLGVLPDLIAWNSIAIKARYLTETNVSKSLIPVEPEKVGVQVTKVNKSSIGGISWIDKNTNGNIDNGEQNLNGIYVQLFSSDNSFIKDTITINDSNDQPGYYLFNNIDFGDYYVRFVKPSNLFFTKYSAITQNKANTNTGITKSITTSLSNKDVRDINAGFLDYPDLALMLLTLLNENIYSYECNSNDDIVSLINNSNMILLQILNIFRDICISELNNLNLGDIGYQAQLQRLIYALDGSILKLNNLNIIPNTCDNMLLSNIIYLLTEYILSILPIIFDKNGLNLFYNKCDCIGSNIYELIIVRFINNISKLENLNSQMNTLLGYLYNYNANNYPKYIPTFRN